MRAKITLQSMKSLQVSVTLYDTELKGFQVRRQAGASVYSVRRKVGKRNMRHTIGEHGAWTPDKARKDVKRLRTVDQDRRRRVDHPLGCDDAAPRLEARSAA